MATLLSRLGRFSFRRRRLVALLWLALLVGAAVLAGRAPAAPPNDFSMPGTEAQQAYDLLEKSFPELNADGAAARVVFRAEDGRVTDAGTRGAIEDTVRALGEAPQVVRVTDPFATRSVSEDGSTAYAQVSYAVSAAELEEDSRTALQETVERAASPGLSVEAGGNAVGAMTGGHSSEAVGLAVAAVVLVVTFGSLLAAGLPLLTALLGVGVGALAIKVLAAPLGLGATTTSLAVMIGLAVGIDYALFVVSRYRAELARGRDGARAAGHAVGTAGSAVVFAGLTVVIALAGLSVVGIPMLTQMGLAAAGTVVLAVLIAVTLVPALLGFCGRRIGPARPRRRAVRKPTTSTASEEAAVTVVPSATAEEARPEADDEAAPAKKAAARKTAKKATAKKAATKKTAAKKTTTAKKATAKKAAKTTTAKKATAKKTASKKTAAAAQQAPSSVTAATDEG